ncbi:MAG: CPBP family intramembrane metalloprotease [Anaerolineae bacterium]|nr:CPBP family intramembrane metalloprotease [Anaerolineae bacterium]
MHASERQKTIFLVVIFSVVVTAVAWIAPLLGGSPSSPGLGFILWATAPLLVSLLLRAITRDWSDLGRKPAIRQNLIWYIVSLLAYPVTMVLAAISGALTSVSAFTEFSLGQFLQIMLTSLPFFFIFAIFEEVGWRGYLAPKLASLGLNRYIAAALVAVVWASWHLPYIRDFTWDYTSESLVIFIPRFYLATFAFSLVFGEIRSITGTFWPAVLMHAIGNAFGHPLAAEYVTVVEGKEYLGSVGNGLFLLAFMILLSIAINRWRVSQAKPLAESVERN